MTVLQFHTAQFGHREGWNEPNEAGAAAGAGVNVSVEVLDDLVGNTDVR
jgi:hypothetical protein